MLAYPAIVDNVNAIDSSVLGEDTSNDAFFSARREPENAQDFAGRWIEPFNVVFAFAIGTTISLTSG